MKEKKTKKQKAGKEYEWGTYKEIRNSFKSKYERLIKSMGIF